MSAGAKRCCPILPFQGEHKRAKQHGSHGVGDDEKPIAVGNTAEAQFGAVMQALQDEELESPGIPMAARKMLAEGAKPWLRNVMKNGLHELQKRIISQIRETFSMIASCIDSKVEDQVRTVEMKMSELKGLETQLQEALKDLAQADAQLEDRREKQSKAEKQVNGSQVADKEFKERQKARAKDVQLSQNEWKHHASVEGKLKLLVEGACPIEDQRKACDKFMNELQKLGLEPSLRIALPMVLERKPEERTSFDLLVLDGVKDILCKTMEAVESKLNAAKEGNDAVKQEADAHVAASVKLYSDLDNEIREVQLAETLRKDREAVITSLENQAEDCRNLLGASTKSSEANKATREKFLEVQGTLENLVSAASSLEEVDASSEAQN